MNIERESLPSEWRIDRAAVKCAEPIFDVQDAVAAALARPLSSLPLPMLCGEGSRVTIVCADPAHDRDCPDDILVPAIIAELKTAGVNDEDITLLAASGTRRPSTEAEKRGKLGDAVVDRYGVVDHSAHDYGQTDDLGSYEGVPVRVNYHAVEADLLIATGVVRPHLYAGYTGGSRAVAVGCAGAGTLHDLHAPRFLDDPTVCAGSVTDNVHQNAIREIAHRAGLQFVVNVVVNPDGEVVAVAAGAPNAVHNRLVEFARDVYEVPVPRESYNVVVTSPSSGLSRDLYRVSSDAAYVTKQREPVLAKGGVVMLPIGADNAARKDAERRRFYDALSGATGMDTLLHQLRRRGLEPGQQYAYTLAQSVVDQNYHVIVVGPGGARVAGGNGLISARDVAEAAALAETFVGSRAHALILPRGRWLMPTYKGVQWFDDRAYAESQAGAGWLDDTVVKSLFPEPGSITES